MQLSEYRKQANQKSKLEAEWKIDQKPPLHEDDWPDLNIVAVGIKEYGHVCTVSLPDDEDEQVARHIIELHNKSLRGCL